MAITIHVPSILTRYTDGSRSLDVGGATVAEALAAAAARFPALGQRLAQATDGSNPFVTIYLNDEDVRFVGGTGAPVRDGDELSLVPAIAGG